MQNSNTQIQREQKLIKKKYHENSRFWKSLFLLEKSSLTSCCWCCVQSKKINEKILYLLLSFLLLSFIILSFFDYVVIKFVVKLEDQNSSSKTSICITKKITKMLTKKIIIMENWNFKIYLSKLQNVKIGMRRRSKKSHGNQVWNISAHENEW